MSIFSSLYIGMSGMRTNEAAISVIGNNIANLNTIGFKASRAAFEALLGQTLIGSAGLSQTGQGAALAAVQRQVTQGALLGTNVTTDLAISGDGYFVVENDAGTPFYTRNGQFQLDSDGFLSSIAGMRLQGYAADINGNVSAALSGLQVGNQTSPPNPTGAITVAANLDRNAPIQSFDVTDAAGTSSFTTSVTVYDSLGAAHQADVYFSQDSPGNWSWNAVVPQGDLDGSADTTPVVIASGTLAFDANGLLATETQTLSTVTFDQAAPQDLLFDFGDELATPGGTGSGSSSYAETSALSFLNQDGFAVGDLSFIQIGQDGHVTGTFTNGNERLLGVVSMARFEAPAALNDVGQNLFSATLASGSPTVGEPQTGGRGSIFSGSLEQSNVDLSNEFVSLIQAQRAFQASSRTITTADEMIQETVNLKR